VLVLVLRVAGNLCHQSYVYQIAAANIGMRLANFTSCRGGGQNVVLVVLVDWFVLAVRSYLELHVWLLYF
jgi:hypothetical protein